MNLQNSVAAIRRATEEDLPVIVGLAYVIWPVTYHPIIGPEQVSYMLEKMYRAEVLKAQMLSGHRFCVCSIGGEDVGFAAVSPEGDGAYKLQKLYLLPKCQGMGVGKALLNWIINDLRPIGATSLTLNVNRHNQAAIIFYERQGFTLLREEDIDIGNGYWMNDYVYGLALH